MRRLAVERRSESRHAADAEMRLRPSSAMADAFTARVLDVSGHGFRVRHDRLTLASGDQVEFEFEGGAGTARAMWNRIVGEEAETGFRVISGLQEARSQKQEARSQKN